MVSRKDSINATTTTRKSPTPTLRSTPMRTPATVPPTHRVNGDHSKKSPPIITRQAIAEAAYFLWKSRGGNDVVNWLEAEAALKAAVPRS
jgi:hypothetical protein